MRLARLAGRATRAFAARPLPWLVPAAVLLRLGAFLGRGDYVGFDEAWYLVLGRNLWAGDGYSLAGLRHVALSPLFPVLAGGLDAVLGHAVWAGRIVAALAGGLLLFPCWSIFRRVGGRRVAAIGCLFVAVMPALAPFGAPRWVGWDLWMGAEPVMHLFLFGGIAFALRALDTHALLDWALAGAAFALAYLARPEAIVVAGLLGLAATGLAAWRPSARTLGGALAFGLAFALLAAPYWLYLHDTLGRWTLSGRGVEISVPAVSARSAEPASPGVHAGPTATIERMLWEGDFGYARRLYALHPSGTRMASDYWGVSESGRRAAGSGQRQSDAATGRGDDAAEAAPAPLPRPSTRPESEPQPGLEPVPARGPAAASGRLILYARALARIVPPLLWPFVLLGAAARGRRRWRRELALAASLLLASAFIAAAVAVDPRTQLFVLPLLAFYAARGVLALGPAAAAAFARRRGIRPARVAAAAALVLTAVMLGEVARQTVLGLTRGSDHHVLGSEYRRAGEALRQVVPPDSPVMSWHPQVALHARRDWRPLPMAPLDGVLRYAAASGAEHLLLGIHNPAPLVPAQFPREYLLLRYVPEAVGAPELHVDFRWSDDFLAIGWVVPR